MSGHRPPDPPTERSSTRSPPTNTLAHSPTRAATSRVYFSRKPQRWRRRKCVRAPPPPTTTPPLLDSLLHFVTGLVVEPPRWSPLGLWRLLSRGAHSNQQLRAGPNEAPVGSTMRGPSEAEATCCGGRLGPRFNRSATPAASAPRSAHADAGANLCPHKAPATLLIPPRLFVHRKLGR